MRPAPLSFFWAPCAGARSHRLGRTGSRLCAHLQWRPHGWTRDCTPRASDRSNVFGIAADNETGRNIGEPGASSTARPPWRVFHHAQDGIHDLSCVDKLSRQLQARRYPGPTAFRLDATERLVGWHYWQHAYNQPLLDFFAAQLR